MNPTTSLFRQTFIAFLGLAMLSLTLPVWSDSIAKSSLKKAAKPGVSVSDKDDKGRDQNRSKSDVIGDSDKGGKSIKRSVAKKAGAAAAVGVGGAVIKSKLKD